MKSNIAIMEEYTRISRLNRKKYFLFCPNTECSSHSVPLELFESAYRSFGKTASGAQRHQCKACDSTFSSGPSTRRHKKTDKTGAILAALLNKMPLRRMAEMLGVIHGHIYSKIDFLDQQCRAFAGRREERLADCFSGTSPVFATDAQVILVNWPVKRRRGSIPLLHMATVHQGSQFVVAATIDYDPDVSMSDMEERMIAVGDFSLPRSMRRNARVWSAEEYYAAMKRLNSNIFSKDDLLVGGSWFLPAEGARVRTDIFMHAHMMLVKKLIGTTYSHATLCLDAEAGLAAATAALFLNEVSNHCADIIEVVFAKGLTNDLRTELAVQGRKLKRDLLKQNEEAVLRVMAQHPTLDEFEALVTVMLERQYDRVSPASRGEALMQRGYEWPFHTKSEPKKKIRLKTDLDQHRFPEMARLFITASLHPVDAYFNLARRRIAGFERGIPTSSNGKRIWHAYGFYRPEMVPKVANILRFYYNYMLTDKSGRTPAMKIGLAKGVVYPRDLIAFT